MSVNTVDVDVVVVMVVKMVVMVVIICSILYRTYPGFNLNIISVGKAYKLSIYRILPDLQKKCDE